MNTGNWKKISKWEVIERQDLVETMSSTFMRKHLAQAQGTPLTSESWDPMLQSEQTQTEILNGTFVPPDDTPELYSSTLSTYNVHHESVMNLTFTMSWKILNSS